MHEQELQQARARAKDAAVKAFIARRLGDKEYLADNKKAMKVAYEVAKDMDKLCNAACKEAASLSLNKGHK